MQTIVVKDSAYLLVQCASSDPSPQSSRPSQTQSLSVQIPLSQANSSGPQVFGGAAHVQPRHIGSLLGRRTCDSTVVSSIPTATLSVDWYWDGWPSSDGHTISVCNQPSRPTQPPTVRGTPNEYRPKCGDALCLGVKTEWLFPFVDKRVGGRWNCVWQHKTVILR